MLDLLDLYTHHRNASINGSLFPIEKYISVRIALNQEAKENGWPRFMDCSDRFNDSWSVSGAPSPSEPSPSDKGTGRGAKPSPNSPQKPSSRSKAEVPLSPAPSSHAAEKATTFRFMLDADRASDEQRVVEEFFADSDEEYETETEEDIDEREVDMEERVEPRKESRHTSRKEHKR